MFFLSVHLSLFLFPQKGIMRSLLVNILMPQSVLNLQTFATPQGVLLCYMCTRVLETVCNPNGLAMIDHISY